jgi:hypothetical protein
MLQVFVFAGLLAGAHAAVPTASVSSVAFSDDDVDTAEIGGDVTWSAPGNTATVSQYNVYLAQDSSGTGKVAVTLGVAVGTNTASIPEGTSRGSFTHIVVYTANSDGEQATPASVPLVDKQGIVTGLSFDDFDLDLNEIGGTLSWQLSGTGPVNGYRIYLSPSSDGTGQVLHNTVTSASERNINIPANLQKGTMNYFLVYATSLAGSSTWQSTLPAAVPIFDREARVQNLVFQDLDLDTSEIGGDITWQAPPDTTNLLSYDVYLSTSASAAGRSQVGSAVAVGNNQRIVPENTQLNTFSHVNVYSASSLGQASTPVAISFTDEQASASQLTFVDLDIDVNEMGGTLSWSPPASASFVVSYSAYLDSQSNNNKIGTDSLTDMTRTIAHDTPVSSSAVFLVSTRSSSFEQSNPASLSINDVAVTITGLSFNDLDLDANQLGGTFTWTASSNPVVTRYQVGLGSLSGSQGWQTANLALATTSLGSTGSYVIQENTQSKSHLLVYAGTQTTWASHPASLAITDRSSLVRNLNFADQDNSEGEIGGTLSWNVPIDNSQVTSYNAYMALDTAGAGRSAIGSHSLQLSRSIADDTSKGSYNQFLVYSESQLAEQTTPRSLSINDVYPYVYNGVVYSVPLNWVGQNDIGIPAKSLFVIVFSAAIYFALCGCIHVTMKGQIVTPEVPQSFCGKIMRSEQFWFRLLFIIIASVVGIYQIENTCGRDEDVMQDTSSCNNWHLMFWYGLALIVTANISTRPYEWYLGEGNSLFDTIKFYLLNKPLKTNEEMEEIVRSKYQSESRVGNEGIGFATLMPSAFITWIFAKSIRNSSVLGGRFGMLGGFAYDAWYVSFFSTAIVCYLLRTRYNFKSLPSAVYKNYGALAVFCFQLCLLFRLFNEVWSNATVIGQFYGPTGSSGYWGACWISVLIPTVYVVMGGMRSSLFSDIWQAGFAVAFLAVVLGSIASDKDFSSNTDAFSYEPSTLWGSEGWQPGWWACFLGGIVQGTISYPFFDPVLTDRAFLGKPKTMLISFFVGGTIAALFIFFYAVIGVYGAWAKERYLLDCGCANGIPTFQHGMCPTDWNPCSHLIGSVGEASDVAWILGRRTYRAAEIFINFIMITASLSTLDSTFTSASKLVSLEFCGWLGISGDNRSKSGPLRPHDQAHISTTHMIIARCFIVFLAFIGTCVLGYEKDAMSATTIAGTSIMGIGMPIWWMCIWKTKSDSRRGWVQAPLAFFVPFCVGWFFGISYFLNGKDEAKDGWTYDLQVGTYDDANGVEQHMYYARFLGTNLVGHAVVIVLFFIFFAFHQMFPKLWFWELAEVEIEVDEVPEKIEEVEVVEEKESDGVNV